MAGAAHANKNRPGGRGGTLVRGAIWRCGVRQAVLEFTAVDGAGSYVPALGGLTINHARQIVRARPRAAFGAIAGLALAIVAAPAQAALIGDVPDVRYNNVEVPALTVVVERTGASFTFNPAKPLENPIQQATLDAGTVDGDRLLLGPGRYIVAASYDGFAVRCGGAGGTGRLPCVSLAGSGSAAGQTTNTVLELAGGASAGIRLEGALAPGSSLQTVQDLRLEAAGGPAIVLAAAGGMGSYELVNVAVDEFGIGDGGPAVQARTDADDSVLVENCLFQGGRSHSAIAMTQETQACNWVIRGCELRDLVAGIDLDGRRIERIKILGNLFEQIEGASDGNMTWGAVGIDIRPGAYLGAPGASADMILIEGNVFRAIAPASVQGVDSTKRAGIVICAFNGSTISHVAIRLNTFENIPSLPEMRKAVSLFNSDQWGPAGVIRYVVLAANSYTALEEHITGELGGNGSPAVPGNVVYPMDLQADPSRMPGVALVGDSTGDLRIDAADIDGNTQDVNLDGGVTPADRKALIEDVLGTRLGDFDLDWQLTGADFTVWQGNYPRGSGALLGEGDADGDGAVSGADFVYWSSAYGGPELFFKWTPPTAPADFWQNTVEEVAACTRRVRRGTVEVVAASAGGRPVYAIRYGPAPSLDRKANYNSAVGGGSPGYYAHKPAGTPATVLIISAVHGAEFESIVGVVNLVHVIETGSDLRGQAWPNLKTNADLCRVILVPLANPDGRARCVPDTWVGRTAAEIAAWTTGVRFNGQSWTWPQVKLYHPATYDMAFLGCYFNDDGINLMHDNWADPWAAETRAILAIAEQEAPDYIVLLHSHDSNAAVYQTDFVPRFIKQKIVALGGRIATRIQAAGMACGAPSDANAVDGPTPPGPSFNLTSYLHHLCGGSVYLFEACRGAIDYVPRTKEQILDTELYHLDELFKYAVQNPVVWNQ